MSDLKIEVGKTYIDSAGVKVKIDHTTLLKWQRNRFYAFAGYLAPDDKTTLGLLQMYTERGAGISGLGHDGFMNPNDLVKLSED